MALGTLEETLEEKIGLCCTDGGPHSHAFSVPAAAPNQKNTNSTLRFPREICDRIIMAPCWKAVTALCCLSNSATIGDLISLFITAPQALTGTLCLSQMTMLTLLNWTHGFSFPGSYAYSSPPLRMSTPTARGTSSMPVTRLQPFLLVHSFAI